MFKKTLTIFVFVLLSFVFVKPSYAISAVSTGFSDKETSINNNVSASTLYFSLSDTANGPLSSPLFDTSGMLPGGSQTKQVRITKGGNEDFKYNISFVKTVGDDVLCSGLNIEAKVDGVTLYNSSLSSLSYSSAPIISGGSDDLEFTISLPSSSSSLKNKSCAFDLVFKAYQTNSDGTWGFSDQHSISNNIASGTWTSSNEVVINEIMWMGSTLASGDEWIELRNTTGNSVDLTGWKIDGAGSGSDPIILAGNIPANGYFLITNLAASASAINDSISPDQISGAMYLDQGGEQLMLRDTSNSIIDQTPTGAWAAGENGTADKKSMERNDTPKDGTDGGNWHTCEDSACHSTTYWDIVAQNWGTPKSSNLSSNDPTSVTIETLVADSSASLNNQDSSQSAQLDTASSSATLEQTPDVSPTPSPDSTPTPTPDTNTAEATPTPTPDNTATTSSDNSNTSSTQQSETDTAETNQQ